MMAVLLAASITSLACSNGNNQPQNTTEKTSKSAADLSSYQQKAETSFNALKKKIGGRLKAVLQSDGAPAAIDVCKLEASDLTAAVTSSEGYLLGRTSHKLRNPNNKVPKWAAERVAWGVGKKASEADTLVVDLGDRVGVLAPMGVLPMCLTCHGNPDSFDAAVVEKLSANYPQDKATGFAAGDLRGWFWAEVPK